MYQTRVETWGDHPQTMVLSFTDFNCAIAYLEATLNCAEWETTSVTINVVKE